MIRLIDAEDIAFAIEENSTEMNGEQVIEVSCAKALIDFAQTFEERPQGEWINQEQGAFYPMECSNCHNQPFCDDEGYVLSNFCSNCGAKMKEADNGNRKVE